MPFLRKPRPNGTTGERRGIRSHRTLLVVLLIGCVGIAATAIAIGTGHSTPRASIAKPPPATTPLPTTTTSTLPPAPAVPLGRLVASVEHATPTYQSPGGPKVSTLLPTYLGSPVVLPVLAQQAGDLQVRLPTKPDGSTAWISAAGVPLHRTPYRIVINLTTRRLLLYQNNALILDAPAGIGTPTDPTPTGHFFVAFFERAPSPAWGPFIMVTSAHSHAISNWEGSGDAIVAIHGPLGDDATIGSSGARLSHGCVRLHTTDLVQLRAVPDGSPVDIIS